MKKKRVQIELRSVIDDAGDKELYIVKQRGYYYKRGNLEVLTYTEKVEDDGEINNMITITPEKVNINRSGVFSVNQQFLLTRKTECLYQHPHGNIHMSIKTKSISHRSIKRAKKGELKVNYEVVLNGQIKRNHQITLTYCKEDHNEYINGY